MKNAEIDPKIRGELYTYIFVKSFENSVSQRKHWLQNSRIMSE